MTDSMRAAVLHTPGDIRVEDVPIPAATPERPLLLRVAACGVCGSDIPRMLELYRSGHLKLDELRTRTYSLDEVNAGYDDMRAGRTLRGVISFG